MKLLFLIIFCFALGPNSCAQKSKVNPFKTVEVPDSINLALASITYQGETDVSSKTGQYIWNMQNRKDLNFKDGIYSFQGFGPHFPRRIFVYNKGELFIFKNEGAFNPKGVLDEFILCVRNLSLSNKQVVNYISVVGQYLKEEEDLKYGQEIK